MRTSASVPTNSATGRVRSARWWLIMVGLLVVASLLRVASTLSDDPQAGDAGLYIRLAENVAIYGVYGSGMDKSMTSAPFLSGAIAAALRVDPRHSEFRSTGTLTNHAAVRQVNLLFVLLLHVGSISIVLLLLGSGRRGLVSALLTILLTHFLLLENPEFINESRQELPTAALLAWTTVAALRSLTTYGRARLFPLAALGALGGALTLSRAVFLQVFPLFVVLLLLLAVGWTRRERLLAAGMILAGLLLVLGPWLARNAIEFGELGVADAGGAVLLIRDMKSDLTPYQHRGSWVHFSPDPIRPAVARLLNVDLTDFDDDGPLRPLARSLIDPETGVDIERIERRSLYYHALDLHSQWSDGFIATGLPPAEADLEADRLAFQRVRNGFREDPLRFPRTTPLFLYRSMWTFNAIQIGPPQGFTPLRALVGLMNIPGFLSVLTIGSLGMLLRRPLWFALGGLPTGLILVHAMFTHAIPRYTRPAGGIMIICIAVGAVLLAGRVTESLRSRRTGAAAR